MIARIYNNRIENYKLFNYKIYEKSVGNGKLGGHDFKGKFCLNVLYLFMFYTCANLSMILPGDF